MDSKVANNDAKEKLVRLLATIFQFDVVDLDFGIYRILSRKKDEISKFINKDLIEEIGRQLDLLGADEQKKLQQDLEEVRKQLTDLGIEDYEKNKKFQERKKQLENITASNELEKEVYNHVYSFFSRYYDKGDFLSKRRYGASEKYSIPYNGEEVLLHWANNDQYYVKTTESFRNFSFMLPQLKVSFRVQDVKEENGNVMPEQDKYFLASSERIYDLNPGQLDIFFEYRPLTDKEIAKYPRPNQDQINEDILETIEKALQKEKTGVLIKDVKDLNALLEKNLYKYTRRNSSDYFIHKDLKSFLERELDSYIKNEVVDLSDVTQLDSEHFNRYVLEVKVLRNICDKIIGFLAQIEDFQKRLWKKKKFVLKTDYCITLDNIDEKYYPQILKNDDQLEEWKKLYGFDVKDQAKGLKATLDGHGGGQGDIEVLKHNPTLMIDTKFFSDDIKSGILEEIENIDERTTGVLIKSENYQALSLLLEKYRGRVGCCYYDPPYNTSENTFLYKNSYKHSSWLSMMKDRLSLTSELLRDDGMLCVAIGDTEKAHLQMLLDEMFSEFNRTATIAIEVNPAGQNIRPNVPALSHDYCLMYAKNIERVRMLVRELTEEERAVYKEKDSKGPFVWDNLRRRGGNSRPSDRPNQWFPLYADISTGRVSLKSFKNAVEVWPIDPKGEKRIWRVDPEGARREIDAGEVSVVQKAAHIEIVMKTRMPIGKKPKTLWDDPKYSATTHGTKLLIDLFGKSPFSYAKSLYLVQDCLRYWAGRDAIVFDVFAGSGTTGHAVMELNKEDGGNRKFILVEMGQYFDTALKPRIQKVVFSSNWKQGKPQDNNGIHNQMIKYHYLEQYEDALENIEFSQKSLSGFSDYFVSYMLDFETRNSKTFLDIDHFKDPFKYKLKVIEEYQEKEVAVDVLETYGYLIGLVMETVKTLHNKNDDNREYVAITGKRSGRSTVVIWRNIEHLHAEKDRDFIQENILNVQYDEVHVNGDTLIKDAILIEEQFKRLMNGS